MPEAGVDLHRLIWSPDDLDGDTLTTSAFPRDDLKGGERYLSVSRTDILDAEVERQRANRQAAAASDNPELVRDDAMSVVLNCGEVCRVEDTNGVRPFTVTSEPIPNDNEAHCGIHNSTGQAGKGYVNQLRTLLVRLASPPQKLDDFLSSIRDS